MIKIKKIKSFYPTKKERTIKLKYADPASFWTFEPIAPYTFKSNISAKDLEHIEKLKRMNKKNIEKVNTLAKPNAKGK
jgi:hypothetical protein